MIHDPIVDIETGLKNRDDELCRPLLQLFHGTEAIPEIVDVLGRFVTERKERKSNSVEAALYPILVGLISEHGYELSVGLIWSSLMLKFEGTFREDKPNQYETHDHGMMYKNTITKMIVDKFGSGRRKRKDGNVIIFDKEKLSRFVNVYDTSVNIRVDLLEDEGGGSGNNGGVAGCERATDGTVIRGISSKNDEFANFLSLNTMRVSDFGQKDIAFHTQSMNKNSEELQSHPPKPPQLPSPPPDSNQAEITTDVEQIEHSDSISGNLLQENGSRRKVEFLKCPYCSFENIHLDVIDHHIKYITG